MEEVTINPYVTQAKLLQKRLKELEQENERLRDENERKKNELADVRSILFAEREYWNKKKQDPL